MAESARTPRPGVIVTRTPLRVSFAGGGTDLPGFYQQGYGAVLSTTIDKYLYVTVKRHGELFDHPIRLNYSETEMVTHLEQIRNAIARECLRLLSVPPPIYISTVADVPESSGLGSSSSFAVGLLNALHVYRGERVSVGQLAEEASHVEIEILKRPVGKQDHYAAAFGGLNLFCFQSDGRVTVEPQRLQPGVVDRLFNCLVMRWTGVQRDAGSVLMEQNARTAENIGLLEAMRGHAQRLQVLLGNSFDPGEFGRVFDETWKLKRRLASRITNEWIDELYERAKHAGAIGGKLCGAGGGGFLLLVAPPERQEALRRALADTAEVSIRYEAQGSQVLLPSLE